MYCKVWRDRVTHETLGGWWFAYQLKAGQNQEEHGPYTTRDKAVEALERILREQHGINLEVD